MESPHERPRLIEARRGFSVGYRGKNLLSAVDPIAQAERLAEAAPLRDWTLYLCPSPLLGYGLPRLLERIETGAPGSAILCVEADQELRALSLNQGGGPSLIPSLCSRPRFRFLGIGAEGSPEGAGQGTGPDEAGERICAAVRRCWGSRRFRRVEVLRLSGAWQLYPELYKNIAEALRDDIATDWSNAMTLVKLGRRYIRNAIRNLAFIPRSPPLSSLSFGRTPVLVLGAGPSLDRFLDTLGPGLAEHSPRAGTGGAESPDGTGRPFGIVCVDTAIPNLKARGIRPDLVIALESQHWNLRDFVGARNWGVPLAMDLSALPATAGVLGGLCAVFVTPWTELALFRRLKAADLLPEPFPPLGSVGLCAAALALRLSGGPVICCGIDFSFSLDSYHARSTPGHREKLRRQNRFRGILNQAAAFRDSAFAGLSKSGLPVRSDPAMRNYRDLFEREFAAEPRLRDIDGSGLPLGIPRLSPGEAAAVLQAAGTGETADRAGGGFPGPEPGRDEQPAAESGYDGAKARRLKEFILGEREVLQQLRDILRGERSVEPGEFEELLDFCDYLWAHFPECAAAGGRRPPGTDIAFLKRIRAEIDPFIRLMELSLREC